MDGLHAPSTGSCNTNGAPLVVFRLDKAEFVNGAVDTALGAKVGSPRRLLNAFGSNVIDLEIQP